MTKATAKVAAYLQLLNICKTMLTTTEMLYWLLMMVVQLTIRKILYLNNIGLRCTEMESMLTILTVELDSQLRSSEYGASIQVHLFVHCTILQTLLKQTITHLKNLMSLKQFSGIMVQLVFHFTKNFKR